MTKVNQPIVITAVTVSMSASFIEGQCLELKASGYTPYIMSSYGVEMDKISNEEKVEWFQVEMEREPSLFKDFISLCRAFSIFRRVRPRIVNAGTPKAGLICMVSAWLTRVPIRIYTLHGFRHESLTGLRRSFQIFIEKVAASLSTNIICVSPSVRALGVVEGIFPIHKAHILNAGSCGIRLDRFSPSSILGADTDILRASIGIKEDDIVLGFVGRLVPRKGIKELLLAFNALKMSHHNLVLLVVGDEESSQPLDDETSKMLIHNSSIFAVGHQSDVAKYYSLMDIFVLPAYWEGFGNVLVEAANMGLPIVTTDVTGCKDAVADGFNGCIIKPKSVSAIVNAIESYLSNDKLKTEHGANGPIWASRFDKEVINKSLISFYDELSSRL